MRKQIAEMDINSGDYPALLGAEMSSGRTRSLGAEIGIGDSRG
jgi:hypothetical protein